MAACGLLGAAITGSWRTADSGVWS